MVESDEGFVSVVNGEMVGKGLETDNGAALLETETGLEGLV